MYTAAFDELYLENLIVISRGGENIAHAIYHKNNNNNYKYYYTIQPHWQLSQ